MQTQSVHKGRTETVVTVTGTELANHHDVVKFAYLAAGERWAEDGGSTFGYRVQTWEGYPDLTRVTIHTD